MSEFRRSLQSILSSKSSWTTTHRQRLMYGVNLNVSSLNADENCVALQVVYLLDSESAFAIIQPAITGLDSASLSPSSIWGHCFIATYQIIMTWMFESRKPLSSLVRYVTIFSVLARCLSGSKGRSTLVVFLRCCCMFASRGASRLSPSLACATGITNAYVKCAG